MNYHFKIHREDNGFWAECMELRGCVTQGDTLEELKANMAEALNLYLDEAMDSSIIHPLPDPKIRETKSVMPVPLEPEIAFSVLVGFYRKTENHSQNDLARLLGVKSIFSTQRVEKRINTGASTIARIKKVFPDFPVNRIFSD